MIRTGINIIPGDRGLILIPVPVITYPPQLIIPIIGHLIGPPN